MFEINNSENKNNYRNFYDSDLIITHINHNDIDIDYHYVNFLSNFVNLRKILFIFIWLPSFLAWSRKDNKRE